MQVESYDKVNAQAIERKCPDCGSLEIDTDGEEMFCKKCGLVLE